MRRVVAFSLIILSACGNYAFGQQAAPVAAPVVAPAAPVAAPAAAAPDASGKYMLREGTDVNLKFAQDLSSKTSSEGDPVALILVDDLMVGNVVVAKAGAHA